MALLSAILQHAPQEWDHHSYSNQRFVRIALNETSSEYQEIKNEFLQKYGACETILSIERIQHPFAYGRFHIRKEQLTVLHRQSPQEKRTYLSITDANKIDIVIEFNCDRRMGGFYQTSDIVDTGYVLVVKMLGDNFDERDTHRYPEYLITYQRLQTTVSFTVAQVSELLKTLTIYHSIRGRYPP